MMARQSKKLNGNIYIIGYGDPTLGSWRWKETNSKKILTDFKTIVNKNFEEISGNLFSYDRKWESNTTPNGWVWEDIGNYYGAGASSLNWRENQYDIFFKAGARVGDKTQIAKQEPLLENVSLVNEVTTGAKGSGDNTIIYLPPYASYGFVRGTIPLGETMFKVAGSMPNAAEQLAFEFSKEIKSNKNEMLFVGSYNGVEIDKKDIPINPVIIYSHQSPPLDSINYWFLKKSVNLYGEAFVKTIGYNKKGIGATDTGLAVIKYFWKQRGIEPSAINIIDGSGLSPANRVTTNALVTVMQYAKKQNWFNSFYYALPEMNGIKMKDGYIGGVRSYTGYIKSKTGAEYTFSFIVNNFDGSAAAVREKMWKVLDILK
ncbi:MAG: D-alanyl-D-alanine carboxypeptidase [Chitinophagaceae bacterium]|nr:D-alanyl-D-alanine carboxypeptidase [Chitinophagaceae bacterium]